MLVAAFFMVSRASQMQSVRKTAAEAKTHLDPHTPTQLTPPKKSACAEPRPPARSAS
jgi:hypothetical protein